MTEYEQIALQYGAKVEADLRMAVESDFGRLLGSIDHWKFMEDCRAKYSWAVPSEDALKAIREYGPFLEIGSGSGYWAYEMTARGIDIIPTDRDPADPHWFNPERGGKQWCPIFKISAEKAVEMYDRPGLLVCWPSYSQSWAHESLKKFRGKNVVYVGEGYGGCTADDGFHEELIANWDEVLDLSIPQWWGLHDRLWVYTRKEPAIKEDHRKVLWNQ